MKFFKSKENIFYPLSSLIFQVLEDDTQLSQNVGNRIIKVKNLSTGASIETINCGMSTHNLENFFIEQIQKRVVSLD